MNVDVNPPQIVGAHPELQDFDGIDQEEVFNLRFNELIDHESLNASSIILKQGDNEVTSEIFAWDEEEGTIVSVKAGSALADGTAYTLEATTAITDTSGNALAEANVIRFSTSTNAYTSSKSIDGLAATAGWWDPEGSGTQAHRTV